MKIKSVLECERKKAQRILNFQLPNYYKKIGWMVFALSFLVIIIAKLLTTGEMETTLKSIAKYAVLLGLLIVSLSKEKVEDEYIHSLRMQSYMFAFLIGVLSAFIVPFINFGAETIVDGEAAMQGIGDFVIIWTLLFSQIFYFSLLKGTNND